jgi:hypothetical protein
MGLNDFLRIVRNVSGAGFSFELQNPPGGSQKLAVRQGYQILPNDPADENATETGSIWFNTSTGKIRIHDAVGVRDL